MVKEGVWVDSTKVGWEETGDRVEGRRLGLDVVGLAEDGALETGAELRGLRVNGPGVGKVVGLAVVGKMVG